GPIGAHYAPGHPTWRLVMATRKNEIIAAVVRAKIELEEALEDLRELPMQDPLVFGFVSRALRSYLNLNRATLQLLARTLKNKAEQQVFIWLEALQVLTGRMEYLVEALKGTPTKARPELIFRKINVVTLVGRACQFYHQIASRKRIRVVFDSPDVPAPPIWTDPIAVAAIMDNLLSAAVKLSPVAGKVSVTVEQREKSLVCSVSTSNKAGRAVRRISILRPKIKSKTALRPAVTAGNEEL